MGYVLTDEGKKYLTEGLPEKRLIDLLKGGPIDFKKAKDQIEGFSIALQWSKKNDWVEIKDGNIQIANEPDKIPEQEALVKVNKGEEIDDNLVSILLKRKLIELERETLAKKAEKFVGKEVTHLTPELIKTGKWKEVTLKPYNVEFVGKKIYPGKRQPYNQFLMKVRKKLAELGFVEMGGPLIETEFWNFDALFQAQNHPSRSWTETYSLKSPKHGDLPEKKIVENVKATHENGWKTGSTGWGYKWDPRKAAQLMPRAHTTPCSARQLVDNPEIPGKYYALGRCFRPDVIDATHGIEFNQLEGIVIDQSLTFKNLLGLLKMFAIEVAGAEKVKFFTDYYPFTEPSAQLSAKHPDLGWIEFGGAGIFREELTKPLGIDAPVIAWGLGIDRLAMFKLGIKDIRYLFSQDLEWLRKKAVVR